ncbi:MAG: flagellar hook-basal body complex protein [Sulfurospirillaceae bacterium]|nr:flagellar hook-basal body complex protein [Sulfurospirillaceae bacterium]MDD2825295.1 flagellar hook-basal body complex protein [Sulfurospirillaceae bacterium]
MNSSFYNGISGVKTQQFSMDVWANNISNISTLGFRGEIPEFSSLFSTALTGSYFDPTSNDVGHGAQSQTTGLDLSQGILQNTDNPFDLAISGEGWFGVQAQDGNIYYTRAGEFYIDGAGNLVDASGSYLMSTLGGNITTTTLDQATLDKFGQYYNTTTSTSATPYAISMLGNVPLGAVGEQSKVTLPDLLYFPAEATQNVSYGANLDPTVTIGPIQIDLNTSDYPATVIASTLNAVDISGTIANTPEILDPQVGDTILVTLTDTNGKKLSISTPLDASLNWNLANYDVSDLDLSQPLSVSAKLQTNQEIANVKHFTTGIISPEGDKDFIDMTFTKVVPQAISGSTWNADVKILKFFENYVVTQYDPTQTYDPAVYDTSGGNVKKIYDPTLYQVDTTSNKVYQIVDNQTGSLTFGGNGELLSNSIPTLSNGGTPLTLNLGTIGSFDGLVSSTSLDKANISSSDGYYEGFLTNYGMDGYGNVIADFSNGRSSAIAKVALYHFQNDQGLEQISSTLFSVSSNSGKPIFYTNADGETFLGSQIYSNKLEGSNVSYATALTELLITQKAFDANAKSITTSDQLIQNAINMKK